MLKDEVALSKEKMKKINIEQIIQSVVEDYNNIQKVKKNIKINYENDGNEQYIINGIENRIEQIIANLLDNSISFSENNQKIEIILEETSTNVLMTIKDEGPGFSETSTQKIFKRFYSNRPASFGKHSGLGLNIVKNIVELHKGTIAASNRIDAKGALVEVLLPKYS
jgi:two-component system sensor histidine kinase ChvG